MSMGLCITPDFIPTAIELEELNPPYLRSILYKLSDIDRLLATNRPLIITLNNQCAEVKGDWSGWDYTVYTLCERFKDTNKLLVLGCGNEFDLYWSMNGSVSPEFGADLARRTARIASNYGVKVAATSLADERWPEYLQIMADLCRDVVDYFDIHPYGQKPYYWKIGQTWMHGHLINIIEEVERIGQKPVICTEYGVKIGDAGGEGEVASFLGAANRELYDLDVPYKCWFAYSDLVGAPSERGSAAFGLLSDRGQKRPAYHVFTTINSDVIIPDETEPKVEPTDLDEWRNTVGESLLDMMQVDGTQPAMASEWRPFDRPAGAPATIEQCIGLNGTTYLWHLPTNQGWRIKPS